MGQSSGSSTVYMVKGAMTRTVGIHVEPKKILLCLTNVQPKQVALADNTNLFLCL